MIISHCDLSPNPRFSGYYRTAICIHQTSCHTQVYQSQCQSHVLLSHSTTHNTTHAFGGDTGHTHTRWWGHRWNLPSAFNPSWRPCSSSRQPGAVGSLFLRRPGTRPSVQSNLGQGAIFSVACFCVGVLCGGNPCEHGENMQTPHRKAREIAHLSTGGLGRTYPPGPTAPHAGIEHRTFLLWGGSVSTWATVPQCCGTILKFILIAYGHVKDR